jgi:regulator of sirC expression with transglutaminase-like and TPR domain
MAVAEIITTVEPAQAIAMHFSSPRFQFCQQVRRPDLDIELAALYIAQEEYPELDIATCQSQLDAIAAQVAAQLPPERYPLKVLQTISAVLFEELKFCGNVQDYYDPRNSLLNQVLQRRMGIPITLSLVYLAVAKRLDFAMEGVNMPGHFLIRPCVEGMELYVDPFNQGKLLFSQDCQTLLQRLYGTGTDLRPAYLEAVRPRQFLARLLGNLKLIYLSQQDIERSLAVIERLLLLFPQAALELRDRGVLYYRLNRITEARLDLEAYLELAPTADDASAVRQLLDTMG